MLNFVFKHKLQFYVLISMLFIINIGAILLFYDDATIFERFFGEVKPILVLVMIDLLSVFILVRFLKVNWFSIYKKKKPRFYLLLLSTIAFVIISILVDLNSPFSKDMNIPFPKSLLFYPVIAFFVEIILHLLPLIVLLVLMTSIFKKTSFERLIWVSILIVATLEPTYQVIFMDAFPAWVMVVVWLNLFLFNMTQFYIFKYSDFISMYLFRIIYYFFWHILWGYFRLELLF